MAQTGAGRRRTGSESAVRVSTLELFFDLVFVFTLTQATAVLAARLTPRSLVQVVMMLAIIFWMYGGYAWLTNAVVPNDRLRRTLYLVGMGGFLAISLAIPDAFGAAGWAFGVGYFVVNAVHTGLFLHGGGAGAWQAMRILGPLNMLTATLVLVGGFTPGAWRYGLWTAAIGVLLVSPYLNQISNFNISPTHFVERHGLLVIIALGESVVAIGVGAAGLTVNLTLVLVAVLGLSLSYLMWWVYFEGEDAGAERALAAVDPSNRAMVAMRAYGYAHYPILLGIVGVAVGVKKAVGHADGHLTLGQALALGLGLAAYLLGDVAFRRVLGLGVARYRVAAAVLAVASVPIGLLLAAGQLFALCLLLGVMLSVEARALRQSTDVWLAQGPESAVRPDIPA